MIHRELLSRVLADNIADRMNDGARFCRLPSRYDDDDDDDRVATYEQVNFADLAKVYIYIYIHTRRVFYAKSHDLME